MLHHLPGQHGVQVTSCFLYKATASDKLVHICFSLFITGYTTHKCIKNDLSKWHTCLHTVDRLLSNTSMQSRVPPAAPQQTSLNRSRSYRATRLQAKASATTLPYRIGHGWDLHRLEEGGKLMIGGVEIAHTKGTIAHSDGDVVLHTITDAILGALCQPDIGQLFPDNDPKWKGAASDQFLIEAVRIMESKGYRLGNIDITVIAERPKLSPHKQKILDNLYSILKASPETINLKAKTHEKVDALGENRAIACEAVALLLHNSI